jgi:predicted nucleic acid-binding protein
VNSLTAHANARELATLHQYQFWDALIIATCAENNIQGLYSEDQGSLPKPLGVRVINPFSA